VKQLLTAAVVAALAMAPIACNKSPEGGQPGTPNSFKLTGPDPDPRMTPGESKPYDVKIERGKDFNRGINFEVKGTDMVKADLEPKAVKQGETPVLKLNLTVAPSAPDGEQMVEITAKPEGGGDPTTHKVKVHVKK